MQSYERIQIAQFPIVPVLDETTISGKSPVVWKFILPIILKVISDILAS